MVGGKVFWPTSAIVPQHAPEWLWKGLKEISGEKGLRIVGNHERWANHYGSELAYVQRHLRELINAPDLEECLHLPAAEIATHACRLNWSYQEYLKARRAVNRHRWDELTDALEEAQRLYQVLETVREAICTDRSWVCRRRALMRLREMIGGDACYRGEIPSCLPSWRFTEID